MRFLFYSILSLCIYLVSCKCRNVEDVYHYLPEEDKAVVPYKNGDTVVFINDESDTVLLAITREVTFEPQLVSGECEVWHQLENDISTLIGSSPDVDIQVILKRDDGDYSGIQLKSDNGDDVYPYYPYRDILTGEHDLDSVLLGGSMFYNVYYHDFVSPDYDLYYNIEYGVVQFELTDRSRWTLLK